MSLTDLLTMTWTPLRLRLKIAFLRYHIARTTRNREVLLKQAENDRLAAQYLQRENCIMRADLNILLGRKDREDE